MPSFAWRFPNFILMICLVVALIGSVTIKDMPVDLFPSIDMPVVVVATFYNGMPPQQIEADITNTFERFFTLEANVDHSESRSLTGVSLIKIYFKPDTHPNAALSNISNLAMADLRRLPPGTLPTSERLLPNPHGRSDRSNRHVRFRAARSVRRGTRLARPR